MNRPALNQRSAAFTLIELLVALSLAGVVVAVAGHIAVQSLQSERLVQRRVVDSAELTHLFESFERDINDRLNAPLQLGIDANSRPTIEFVCLAGQPTQRLHTPRLPSQVTYRLRRTHDGDERLQLLRRVTDLVQVVAGDRSEVVADGIESFEVVAWVEGSWFPLNHDNLERLKEPDALRLTCRIAGKFDTRTLLLARFALMDRPTDER